MSPLFFKIVIVGVPFGFSLMWFVYWIVKLYKAKNKIPAKKTAAASDQNQSETKK
jgi:hypothetical protein